MQDPEVKLPDFANVLAIAAFFLPLFSAGSLAVGQSNAGIWLGTAGNRIGMDKGIYFAKLSDNEKSISRPRLVHKLENAGWVASSPSTMMYATGKIDGKHVVVSFDGSDQSKPIQHQEIGDGGSCFITTDKTGRILMSAQYGGGSIAVFPIDEDGHLGPRSQLFEHEGGSRIVGKRQNSPHPHYVAVSPDNRFAFVPDLGLDQLIAYRIDVENQKLESAGSVDVEPGGGPRHMKFHPSGKFAFVLNEFSLAVTTFSYDAASGAMTKLHSVEALNDAEKKQNSFNSASEIRIHNSGKMVVTANRGHDSLSVFTFDAASKNLTRVQVEPIRGSWPRNFNFIANGKLLIAAGSDSNSLTLFSVDSSSNRLKYLQHKSVLVPAPICVCVVE